MSTPNPTTIILPPAPPLTDRVKPALETVLRYELLANLVRQGIVYLDRTITDPFRCELSFGNVTIYATPAVLGMIKTRLCELQHFSSGNGIVVLGDKDLNVGFDLVPINS